MVQANAIDISEFQDPNTFDYQAAKDAGIKTLIIRASVDLREDKHVREHIANAKKYGFNWNLYHYFYNDSGEIDFAVKKAQELGLTSGQILFLDMEDKSLPNDWNGMFSQFRKEAKDHFRVGLYCSDSPYNAKFQDSQLKSLGVIRWVASYSYEPKNYDVWQMSGAGGGGFGAYKGDVDRDYDPHGILVTTSTQPTIPEKPDTPEVIPTDLTVRNIVLQAGYDSDNPGIYGLGCSYDNGKTFKVYWTVYGRKYYQEDADRLWPFLKDKITTVLSIDWDSIQNKPKFVTPDELEARLDKLSVPTVKWADIEDKPAIPSIDGLAKETELDNYAKKSDIPQSMTWSQITGKPNVATKDDVDYLKTLIGSSSGSGDAGLTIEAIVELIKHHFKAKVDVNSGNLLIDVDGVSNASIADAVATKVAQSLQLKLQGSDLVAEIGGTE